MYDGSSQSPLGTAAGDLRGDYRIMGRHGSPSASTPAAVGQAGQTNIAFFDGHAETVTRKSLPNTFQELYNADNGALKRQLNHPYPFWRIDEQ